MEQKENQNGVKVKTFAQPTYSTLLPEYSNLEQDIIRQAFQTGNYRSLHKLPNYIKPHAVLENRVQNIDVNKQASAATIETLAKNGLFYKFTYDYSEYDRERELNRIEYEKHLEILQNLGHGTFISGSVSKGKVETPREIAPSDPITQVDLFADTHQSDLTFRPSGNDRPLQVPSVSSLPSVLSELRIILAKDWSDISPPIVEEKLGLIICSCVVRDDELVGLSAYMNTLLMTNDIISKYRLVKVRQVWNLPYGDSCLFAFRPPWVKTKEIWKFEGREEEDIGDKLKNHLLTN